MTSPLPRHTDVTTLPYRLEPHLYYTCLLMSFFVSLLYHSHLPSLSGGRLRECRETQHAAVAAGEGHGLVIHSLGWHRPKGETFTHLADMAGSDVQTSTYWADMARSEVKHPLIGLKSDEIMTFKTNLPGMVFRDFKVHLQTKKQILPNWSTETAKKAFVIQ